MATPNGPAISHLARVAPVDPLRIQLFRRTI